MAGMPYMVGERGPELFIPQSGGRIASNGISGGGGGRVEVFIHNFQTPFFDQHIDVRAAGVSAKVFKAGAKQSERERELRG
jgi:phage-related minor tail protein